tara:strand:+ start:1974 stop:2555 length:582 start_codon:yes stop_codon:yes gene_type:complete
MKLVFATNNLNKLSEIKSLVPKGLQILSLDDINFSQEIPETQETLEGNALQKARYIFDNFGYNCFSDDTGLEIDILNGEPGVYSARYAGNECNAEKNINKVILKLEGLNNRKATFRTVIALIIEGKEYFFEGKCEGFISKNKSGLQGFGYDPIFIPLEYDKTFAEMTEEEKGKISHRGKAVRKLVNFVGKIFK